MLPVYGKSMIITNEYLIHMILWHVAIMQVSQKHFKICPKNPSKCLHQMGIYDWMHCKKYPTHISYLLKIKALKYKECQNVHFLFLYFVCPIGCLMSQQQARVSQGRICSDKFTCCHTEVEAADQTFFLIKSQYTDTGPISPSADPITPDAWQGSHWSASESLVWLDLEKSCRQRDSNPGSSALEGTP